MVTMSPVHPYVIILVLNWNLPAETIACVNSLLAGDYPHQHVVIVDNGSTDDSLALLRDHFGDRVTILETGENLYYAGGNNVGLHWALDAGADWVVVLNNDTLVAPDMVSLLVRVGSSSPEVGVVGPMIYWGDITGPSPRRGDQGRRIWAMGSRRRWWLPFPHDVGKNEIDTGQYRQPLDVDYAVGCCMMISRQVLMRVGLFDPAYRMYYEDADLSARVRRAGFRLVIEPRARVWHLVAATAGRQAAMSCYQKTRYRMRFYRQHTARFWIMPACVMLGAQELARAVTHWLHRAPDLASARWRGLRDGLKEKMHGHRGI
jgi:GT2 family glycosyltransferase